MKRRYSYKVSKIEDPLFGCRDRGTVRKANPPSVNKPKTNWKLVNFIHSERSPSFNAFSLGNHETRETNERLTFPLIVGHGRSPAALRRITITRCLMWLLMLTKKRKKARRIYGSITTQSEVANYSGHGLPLRSKVLPRIVRHSMLEFPQI